jgi:NADH:ubiquinone oxidoreductase subunit H
VDFSTANKVGFVLAILLGVVDLGTVLFPTPEGEVGPPFAILLFVALLGLITIVAVIIGWRRGNRAAIRGAAVARILSVLLALPAFAVSEVPAALKAAAAIFTLVSIVTLVLMLSPGRRSSV